MELQGERLIRATLQHTWWALNDADTLKACVPGCESLVRHDNGTFAAVLVLRVGPLKARLRGRLSCSDVQPPHRYTLSFEGEGGVAGFGKGSADVALTPHDDETLLAWHARVHAGGRIAQIGSRLVGGKADKLVAKFFDAFELQLRPVEEGGTAVAAASG